jgi:hypothetical protein
MRNFRMSLLIVRVLLLLISKFWFIFDMSLILIGLTSLIVKYGDDCRQERFALQLIGQFQRIFLNAKLPLYIDSVCSQE